MTYIDNPSRIQADALDRVRETAAALYRIIARIEHASTHARLEMERGALPSGGGIGGAAYLGHQTPNDLTIATVRVNDAIDHARIVGLDGDQINAAYDFERGA